jgi:hypothetical protein
VPAPMHIANRVKRKQIAEFCNYNEQELNEAFS